MEIWRGLFDRQASSRPQGTGDGLSLSRRKQKPGVGLHPKTTACVRGWAQTQTRCATCPPQARCWRLNGPSGRKPPAGKGNARNAKEQSSAFRAFLCVGVRLAHILRIHGSLARAFVRQISFWPQGTGVRLFPRPGKQEPGEGHTPGINRVRARLGAYTNPVRDLPAAGARACEAQGKKRQGARLARRSRAGVRDAGEKKTGRTALREAVAPQAASRVTSLPVQTALRRDGACASCSPQARRCVSRRSWGCCGGVPRWEAFRRASGRGCAPWR